MHQSLENCSRFIHKSLFRLKF
ncbi:hypothetical protein STPYR_11774 [uncultured Stenotrophomonas sp.]|uniref:Uncharacterized protein n=1 Tax=uncultured Stenotrophomonas sp. TaxID=165438 RepID=A0A1Y5Q9W3_9GAMM|nr:hypothetical protein STPYR_11774 [uncultured Stenotrophomonas sp.]